MSVGKWVERLVTETLDVRRETRNGGEERTESPEAYTDWAERQLPPGDRRDAPEEAYVPRAFRPGPDISGISTQSGEIAAEGVPDHGPVPESGPETPYTATQSAETPESGDSSTGSLSRLVNLDDPVVRAVLGTDDETPEGGITPEAARQARIDALRAELT